MAYNIHMVGSDGKLGSIAIYHYITKVMGEIAICKIFASAIFILITP